MKERGAKVKCPKLGRFTDDEALALISGGDTQLSESEAAFVAARTADHRWATNEEITALQAEIDAFDDEAGQAGLWPLGWTHVRFVSEWRGPGRARQFTLIESDGVVAIVQGFGAMACYAFVPAGWAGRACRNPAEWLPSAGALWAAEDELRKLREQLAQAQAKLAQPPAPRRRGRRQPVTD